jgi:predicted DNA-binding protein
MSTMVRKQVYIEPQQEVALKQWSMESGQSEAEIIRQAIERWLEEQARQQQYVLAAWQAEKAFIADLMAQGVIPGGRTWKREDLYDR